MITGHYDTKAIAMTHFVGANDGGSSTGELLQLARSFSTKHRDDLYLCFSTGKRRSGNGLTATAVMAASIWCRSGAQTVPVTDPSLINVDMIGTKIWDSQR